jgi:hypothetical protein
MNRWSISHDTNTNPSTQRNLTQPPPRRDKAGSEKAVEARTAPEIEDGFAGLERGDRLRVAAAQAEVCAFGQGGDFLGL